MSARLLSLARQALLGSTNRKLILVRLVDAADDDGTNIYPSVETIALSTELSRRTVQRTLRAFEDEGLLEVVSHRTGGQARATRYRLNLVKLESLKGDTSCHPKADPNGDTICHPNEGKGDTICHPKVSPVDANRVTNEHPKGDNGDTYGDKLCHPTPQTPQRVPLRRKNKGVSPLPPSRAKPSTLGMHWRPSTTSPRHKS